MAIQNDDAFISRKQLLDKIPRCDPLTEDKWISKVGAIAGMISLIYDCKPVDPVPHGYWIHEGHDEFVNYYRCSNCEMIAIIFAIWMT